MKTPFYLSWHAKSGATLPPARPSANARRRAGEHRRAELKKKGYTLTHLHLNLTDPSGFGCPFCKLPCNHGKANK